MALRDRLAPPPPTSSLTTALICSGAVGAQFVGGKAVRDALYLSQMDVTTLPAMVIATAVVSIALVALSARTISRIQPAEFVSGLFGISTLLLVAEWMLISRAPRAAVILVYLQVSALGPMLGSGFWLIASERFDPRTAKRWFGRIQGAGTFGGLVGGLLAERVAAVFGIASMLLVLAAIGLLCTWQIRRFAQSGARRGGRIEIDAELAPAAPQSGLRVLAATPYLMDLAALVLIGTTSSALIEYLFKVQAVGALGRGEPLLRFFAIYYAATSLITFLIQTSSSRLALERFGLGWVASSPAIALCCSGIGGLVAPGLASMTITRGSESVLRGSLYRAGYELFYTPIPPAEKRAAKSVIDVGFDRLGDALGGGIVRLAIVVAPQAQYILILSFALASSAAAIVVASRLSRGYIQTLERSLLNRAVELELSDIEDMTTRTTLLRTISGPRLGLAARESAAGAAAAMDTVSPAAGTDAEVRDILRLRSRDRDQVLKVLRRDEGVSPALIPHVIPLLAWDAVSNHAILALRRVAEEHVGELTDHLIDPNEDFAVRRRLARVFSVCVSQRAADGMMLGLDDQRFEVRVQCGRSLSAILDKNMTLRVDKERVFALVLREVAVGGLVWESRRLLDRPDAHDASSFVDEFVRDRAGQSLAHVFTLLSFVLPREPLRIAFLGLYTEDRNLQGTALEYLEGVLPAEIRNRLWPFLEDRRDGRKPQRSRQEVLEELLRSNASIVLNLEEMKRRAGVKAGQPDSGV